MKHIFYISLLCASFYSSALSCSDIASTEKSVKDILAECKNIFETTLKELKQAETSDDVLRRFSYTVFFDYLQKVRGIPKAQFLAYFKVFKIKLNINTDIFNTLREKLKNDDDNNYSDTLEELKVSKIEVDKLFTILANLGLDKNPNYKETLNTIQSMIMKMSIKLPTISEEEKKIIKEKSNTIKNIYPISTQMIPLVQKEDEKTFKEMCNSFESNFLTILEKYTSAGSTPLQRTIAPARYKETKNQESGEKDLSRASTNCSTGSVFLSPQ